jgi:hypothetical protein
MLKRKEMDENWSGSRDHGRWAVKQLSRWYVTVCTRLKTAADLLKVT